MARRNWGDVTDRANPRAQAVFWLILLLSYVVASVAFRFFSFWHLVGFVLCAVVWIGISTVLALRRKSGGSLKK